MKYAKSILVIVASSLPKLATAQPRALETYRFELVINQQMCTRPDGGDYLCSTDGNRSIIEVPLEEVPREPLEDRALAGRSEPLGVALSSTLQHLPTVEIRKSLVGGTSIYTVRFRTKRSGDDGAPSFETVYIEEGEELDLQKPLLLMADRLENSPRYFRQVVLTLDKLR